MPVKMLAALAFVGFIAACTQPPEPQPVVVDPVSTEPTYTSKY